MMKGFFFHRWMQISLQIVSLIGLIILAPPSFAKAKTVLIIKSSDNIFFNKTVERLINQTHPQVKFYIKTLESMKKDESLINKSNLFITLGIAAANYSIKKIPHSPVIHSYITEFQYLEHNKNLHHKNHYSILLDQPLDRYLNFIKQLTSLEKVGIIRNNNNLVDVDMVKRYESSLNIQLEQEIFEQGDNPLNKIKDLLEHNDVLLSLPNPEVYNRKTLKGILLTTYRQNKPVISYSPAHVKSGALAAIFSSPDNIGRQIADLLNDFLKNKNFKPNNYYHAAEFDIRINRRVAKSLGLNLANKQQIIKNLQSEKIK